MRLSHGIYEFLIERHFPATVFLILLTFLFLLFSLSFRLDDYSARNNYLKGGVENQEFFSNELWSEDRERIAEKMSRLKIVLFEEGGNREDNYLFLLLELEKALSRLPPEIFNSTHNLVDPLKIIIVDELISIDGQEIAGIYYWQSNQIFIKDQRLSLFSYEFMLLHEIGHAYDYSGWPINIFTNQLQRDIFKKFAGKEKPPTQYAGEDPGEDFAETFALYFLFPDYLKRVSPLRYEWMKNNLPK